MQQHPVARLGKTVQRTVLSGASITMRHLLDVTKWPSGLARGMGCFTLIRLELCAQQHESSEQN